jgi:hypothetical protein
MEHFTAHEIYLELEWGNFGKVKDEVGLFYSACLNGMGTSERKSFKLQASMLAVATDVPDLSAPGMARLYPIGKFPSNGRQTSNVYCKVERGEIPKMLGCQYAWLRNVPNQGFTVPPSFKRISYAWFVGLGVPRHTGPPVNAPLRCLPPSAHPILDEPLDKVRTRHTSAY